MTDHIFDTIPFEFDPEIFIKRLRVRKGKKDESEFREMAAEVQKITRPKAAYRLVFIDKKGHDSISMNGITLTSRVMRVNLEKTHRIFPFIATSGQEIETWAASIDGLLKKFWADALKEAALRIAIKTISQHVRKTYELTRFSTMTPGSIDDWPLQEQSALFDLMHPIPDTLQVTLKSSHLMIPMKSVSGIFFPTETHFESCQLCQRERCPNRRAPYDQDLYQQRFA
ncbi:MAG: hypothetical protein JEZ06_20185 [Anaerolineaceae bacterium]|nr:hypothetical protein [Anaerolineaceae bacterium]